MMRLPGKTSRDAGWGVRLLYFFVRSKRGVVPNPLRIYAYRPSILRAFLGLASKVERRGELPDRLKRLAMYWTSRKIECSF